MTELVLTLEFVQEAAQWTRQQWLAVLAQAPAARLAEYVTGLGTLPHYQLLRPAETGLTMVRGRASGTGQVFNLGEMTLTRCVVTLTLGEDTIMGFGYVAGRDRAQAEQMAVCDGLLQHPSWHQQVCQQVLAPLQQQAKAAQAEADRQTAATRVSFFTLQRGE